MTTERLSRTDTYSKLRAVGILLRALQSYSDNYIHSITEIEGEVISKRDFSGESRVIYDLLLRLLQILHELSAETFKQETSGEQRVASFQNESEYRRSLAVLGDWLRDVTSLIDAMVEKPPVTLHAWTSFNNVLIRTSNGSAAIRPFADAVTPGVTQLHPKLLVATGHVTDQSLNADFRLVLSTLSLQLEFLAFIETSMKERRSLKGLLPVLMLIKTDITSLLDYLEKHTLKSQKAESSIIDAIDGTAYAIRMELRKAFEYELTELITEQQPHYIYAKLENAHGLLRDCFQQSIVGLAQLFDPNIEGSQLFASFQTKLDQSLVLRDELWRLLRSVRRSLESSTEAKPNVLAESISTFRDGSLRHLMYKDRESFDRFFEEIETSEAMPQLVHVLHRFEAYLQMLFTQVNLRAVLTSHPFEVSEGTKD